MRKYLYSIVIALFALAALLPMQVRAAGNAGAIELGSVTVVSDHAAGEKISSMEFSLSVVSDSPIKVGFEFSENIKEKAVIAEYKYDEATQNLSIYIAGTKPLFESDTKELAVGNIVALGESGVTAEIKVVDDSLKYVYGSSVRVMPVKDGEEGPDVIRVTQAPEPPAATESPAPTPVQTPDPTPTPTPEVLVPTPEGSTPVPPAATYDIKANAAEGGTVKVSGTCEEGTTVTVEAVPNVGYKFKEWKENDVTVSTSASYQFTASQNRTLTAVFEKVQSQEPAQTPTPAPAQTPTPAPQAPSGGTSNDQGSSGSEPAQTAGTPIPVSPGTSTGIMEEGTASQGTNMVFVIAAVVIVMVMALIGAAVVVLRKRPRR